MSDIYINGLFALAGAVLGAVPTIILALLSSQQERRRAVESANREARMALCVEVARAVSPFRAFVKPSDSAHLSQQEIDQVGEVLSDCEAFRAFWSARRGELELFLEGHTPYPAEPPPLEDSAVRRGVQQSGNHNAAY